MTRENNPLEINLDRFCHSGNEIEFIGQSALADILRSPLACGQIIFSISPFIQNGRCKPACRWFRELPGKVQQKMSFLIKNVTVVTLNNHREVIEDGAVFIKKDRIEAVGDSVQTGITLLVPRFQVKGQLMAWEVKKSIRLMR